MTVEVVVRSKLGEQETLLQPPSRESFVDPDAPAYQTSRLIRKPLFSVDYPEEK
jgi:hypothetical protein